MARAAHALSPARPFPKGAAGSGSTKCQALPGPSPGGNSQGESTGISEAQPQPQVCVTCCQVQMCSWLLGHWKPLRKWIRTPPCSCLHSPIHPSVLPAPPSPAGIRAAGQSISYSQTRADLPLSFRSTRAARIRSQTQTQTQGCQPQEPPQNTPATCGGRGRPCRPLACPPGPTRLPAGAWTCPELPHLQSFPGAGCSSYAWWTPTLQGLLTPHPPPSQGERGTLLSKLFDGTYTVPLPHSDVY